MKHLKTFENDKEDIAFSVGDIIKNIDGYLNNKRFKVVKIYKKEVGKYIHINHILLSELMSFNYFVDFLDINNEVYKGTFARRFIKASEEETKDWELKEISNKYNI